MDTGVKWRASPKLPMLPNFPEFLKLVLEGGRAVAQIFEKYRRWVNILSFNGHVPGRAGYHSRALYGDPPRLAGISRVAADSHQRHRV